MTSQSQAALDVPYGEKKTKTAKKDYFIENLSPLIFFKQSSLNFQNMFFTL